MTAVRARQLKKGCSSRNRAWQLLKILRIDLLRSEQTVKPRPPLWKVAVPRVAKSAQSRRPHAACPRIQPSQPSPPAVDRALHPTPVGHLDHAEDADQRIESILTVAAGAEAVLNLCNEVLGEGDASVASPIKQADCSGTTVLLASLTHMGVE